MRKPKLCHRVQDAGCVVELHQQGVDRFTVTYGRQVKSDLTYDEAATEYGAAIMHGLACEGRLDNRKRGENW